MAARHVELRRPASPARSVTSAGKVEQRSRLQHWSSDDRVRGGCAHQQRRNHRMGNDDPDEPGCLESHRRREPDGTVVGSAVAPTMMSQGSGSIIKISSVGGLGRSNACFAYGATNWALRGMTRGAAQELGPYGVRVNAVLPGTIESRMIEGQDRDAMLSCIPSAGPIRSRSRTCRRRRGVATDIRRPRGAAKAVRRGRTPRRAVRPGPGQPHGRRRVLVS